MRELEFSRDAWHYHLAQIGGFHCWDGRTDICSYSRAVFTGLVSVAGAVLMVGFLCYGAFDLIRFCFSDDDWMSFPAFAFCIALAIATLIGTLAGAVTGVVLVLELGESEAVHDSFVAEWWRSFKEKTCVRVRLS